MRGIGVPDLDLVLQLVIISTCSWSSYSWYLSLASVIILSVSWRVCLAFRSRVAQLAQVHLRPSRAKFLHWVYRLLSRAWCKFCLFPVGSRRGSLVWIPSGGACDARDVLDLLVWSLMIILTWLARFHWLTRTPDTDDELGRRTQTTDSDGCFRHLTQTADSYDLLGRLTQTADLDIWLGRLPWMTDSDDWLRWMTRTKDVDGRLGRLTQTADSDYRLGQLLLTADLDCRPG